MPSTTFHAMGSKISVIADSDAPSVRAALGATRGWFQAWEVCLSRFRPESELSQLNRQSGQPVQVSQTLWEVLQAALEAARYTGGLITPTILPAIEAAGYDKTFSQLEAGGSQPTQHVGTACAGASDVSPHSISEIQINSATRTVSLPSGMRLDLGGFAKGWAADETARRLGKIAPTLVDAGGDIAVSGPRSNGSLWPVGIAHPENPGQNLAVVQLNAGGLATSGRNYRRWIKNGQPQHHLIDPRSHQPAVTDVVTASVVASSALAAETAAKMAVILGSQAGDAWLQEHHWNGVLVLEDGRIQYTQSTAITEATNA